MVCIRRALQHFLGKRLTHRFLGALEQGFAGAIQHLTAQRTELGEQIRAGLLEELGLAFLAAQLIHRGQCTVMTGLERIALLAHALQLRAAHRCLFTGLLRLLLRGAEL